MLMISTVNHQRYHQPVINTDDLTGSDPNGRN